MKPLSPAMRRAIELARGKNGKLHLHHFGHWFGLKSTVKVRGSTIQALVDRGLAEYTNWGEFGEDEPIEVTLTAKALDIGRLNLMLTYHNDPAIKAKYLARVAEHKRQDKIVQGYYWRDGRGCAVGCTVHSDKHNRYEIELGIPEPIARLEDEIFEGLPLDLACEWPGRFLSAIEPGQDLSRLQWRFLFWLLTDFDPSWQVHPVIGTAVRRSAEIIHVMAMNGKCERDAAESAARAAWNARAAWDAGAAWPARASEAAAGAAESAAGAVAGAAWAAESAARASEAAARASAGDAWAAGEAAFVCMADKLIELLSDSPYVGSTPIRREEGMVTLTAKAEGV